MIYLLYDISSIELPILSILYFIKQILTLIFIFAPIILIIMSILDIIKMVVNIEKKKEITTLLVKRFLYLSILFLLPNIIKFLSSAIGYSSDYVNLWANAEKENIYQLKIIREEEIKAEEQAAIAKKNKLESEKKNQSKKAQDQLSEIEKNNATNNGSTGSTNSSNSSPKRDEVVEYAMQFVGKPYVYGGNDLNTGVDCSGFTQQVYKHFGIDIPRTASEQAHSGTRVEISNLKKGDLVFYAYDNGYIHHVALYIGDGKIVHAMSSRTGIVTRSVTYNTPAWGVSLLDE